MQKFDHDSQEDTEALLASEGHANGSPKPRQRGPRNANISQVFLVNRRRVLLRILTTVTAVSLAFAALMNVLRPWADSRYPETIESQATNDTDADLPPRYTAIRSHIRDLPQHNTSLPVPEGSRGRYIQFSSQIGQLGWNNVLNEVLLNAHLAYRSNRAYVFHDYEWKREYWPWPSEMMFEDPPRTPLAALLSGPVVGDPWAEGVKASVPATNVSSSTFQGMDDASYSPPRSVSVDYWNIVCPPHRRRIVSTSAVKPWYHFDTNARSGVETFNIWLSILTDPEVLDRVANPNPDADDDNCVEIVSAPREEDKFPQVFDLWLWGSERILDLWEEFKRSPMSSVGLGTGSVVERCVRRNMRLFSRSAFAPGTNPTEDQVGRAAVTYDDPMERTLAVHVRRGDFKAACQDLADYNSTYYSWNQLHFLPDHFTPPVYPAGKPVSTNNNSPENIAIYLTHCLPTDEAIVRKIENSRDDWETQTRHISPTGRSTDRYIDTLFLLTNERDSEWLSKLKSHFTRERGWRKVVISSLDVTYGDAQEKDVGMAVDMDLARRAAVFIGNGFSSFTSNILHRRLVDGKIPISNRFF